MPRGSVAFTPNGLNPSGFLPPPDAAPVGGVSPVIAWGRIWSDYPGPAVGQWNVGSGETGPIKVPLQPWLSGVPDTATADAMVNYDPSTGVFHLGDSGLYSIMIMAGIYNESTTDGQHTLSLTDAGFYLPALEPVDVKPALPILGVDTSMYLHASGFLYAQNPGFTIGAMSTVANSRLSQLQISITKHPQPL